MKCIMCQSGETSAENVALMLERDGHYMIVENVPAEVCQICGERYFDSAISQRIGELADANFPLKDLLRSGVTPPRACFLC